MAFLPFLLVLKLSALQVICYPAVDYFVADFEVILVSVSWFSHVVLSKLFIFN